MKHYSIINAVDGTLLYEGRAATFKACVEKAVMDKVDLSHADLRGQDLRAANLDDAHMLYADFSGSNLSGANLSESNLQFSKFENTALYNTCFAYSDLQRADFSGGSFGGTDITGSNISFAQFSTLSCYSLDFIHAHSMTECVFHNGEEAAATTSRPPIVIKGLDSRPIILMDNGVIHGNRNIAYADIQPWIPRLLSTLEITGSGTQKSTKS